jgi:hypothetical protein
VVVVLAARPRSQGTELLVVPVTSQPPRPGDAAVEIPARVRQHLGLTGERSWVVADELNRFTWPGPDIRPVRGKNDLGPFYGKIPAKLFEQVRTRLVAAAQAGRLKVTKRTE